MPLTDWGLLGRQGSTEGPPPEGCVSPTHHRTLELKVLLQRSVLGCVTVTLSQEAVWPGNLGSCKNKGRLWQDAWPLSEPSLSPSPRILEKSACTVPC